MPCLITSGYPLQCRDNVGGVQNIYIASFTPGTPTFTTATGSVTGFTGATPSFYTFNQPLESANFTSAGAFSTENGTSMYTQTIEMVMQKLSGATSVQINTLGQGVWRIMVLDQNGKYWMIGIQNGARVTAATPGVGKAMGDMNGAIVTFEAKEPLTAFEVNSAVALSMIV
jgi:hypothetical protein